MAFRADAPIGPGWYQRATRAHLNCVENLPVYGAIVVVVSFTGRTGPLLDALSVAVLGARICQTLIHVLFVQTERAVSLRFTFFTVQLVSMPWMAVVVVQGLRRTTSKLPAAPERVSSQWAPARYSDGFDALGWLEPRRVATAVRVPSRRPTNLNPA
jgi:uncharacterized MAPEG superfamily protein